MKSNEEILNIVRAVAKEYIDLDPEKIVPGADLVTDLGLDSLGTFDLIMAIEDQVGVELTDKEVADCKTVENLVAKLHAAQERALQAQPA